MKTKHHRHKKKNKTYGRAAGEAANLVNYYAGIPPPLDVEYCLDNSDDNDNEDTNTNTNPWRQPHLILEELLQQNQVLQDAWKTWLQTQQQQQQQHDGDDNVMEHYHTKNHHHHHHPSFMECLTDLLGDDLEEIRQAAAVALAGEGDDDPGSSAAVEILVECLQTTVTKLFTKQEQDEIIRNHHNLTQNDDNMDYQPSTMHTDENDHVVASSSPPSNLMMTAHERYQRNNRI